MREDKYYKIMRLKDGLYSTGGTSPRFAPRGKVWRNIGFLKNHLHQVDDNLVYTGCVVIELVTRETEESRVPVVNLLVELAETKKAKELERERAWQLVERRRELEQLAALKAKYPQGSES